jgi:hypothetical protein
VNFRWCAYFLPLLALFTCSGPTLKGNVYRGDGLTFTFGQVPPTWRQLDVSHARLAFRDEPAELTVLVNARCGKDAEDVPLLALTQHLFMTFTEREILEQKVIPMDGREAMHSILRAKLDGVGKMFDAYVLKKDGCIYDFVAISRPEKFDANRQTFESFVAGFHTVADQG